MEVRPCLIKRGSALLSALFIMTLVAIAATAMSTRLQLDIYHTRLTIESDKLLLASQAVTFWAMDVLSRSNNKLTIQGPEGELLRFPERLKSIYPNVITRGSLYDLQARFNLNNLQDKVHRILFLRLLEQVLTKTSARKRRHLIDATIYWISPYQPERGHDDYLNFYLSQKSPYFPGFQPMKSLSEFRLIKGVNAKIYKTLSPYITVLPETTPININTASKPLLMSLGNGLSETQANELLQARQEKKMLDLKALTLLLQKLDIPGTQVTIESQYFLSLATTSTKDLSLMNYTIIKRSKNKKGKISVRIIYESLNTL